MKLEGAVWGKFDRHLQELIEKGIALNELHKAVDSAWDTFKK